MQALDALYCNSISNSGNEQHLPTWALFLQGFISFHSPLPGWELQAIVLVGKLSAGPGEAGRERTRCQWCGRDSDRSGSSLAQPPPAGPCLESPPSIALPASPLPLPILESSATSLRLDSTPRLVPAACRNVRPCSYRQLLLSPLSTLFACYSLSDSSCLAFCAVVTSSNTRQRMT